MTHRRVCALGVVAMTAVFGAPVAVAQDATVGRQLYEQHCALCHGADGQGDGPRAALIGPPPADLTQLAADGVFPLLRVVRQIDGRAPLAAHGGAMPAFGGAFEGDGPDVALPTASGQPVLMPQPLADIVTYLQEIQP